MAAAAALAHAGFASLPADRGIEAWKGYRVLLVDAALPESEILADLKAVGLSAVLSESTQPVLVSNWSGLESMSLADLRGDLAAEDPRYDSYLKRIGLWFEARVGNSAYRAYYLKEAPSVYATSSIDAAVKRGLESLEGRYLMPDVSAPHSSGGDRVLYFALSLIVMALAIALAFLGARSKHRAERILLRFAIAMPWAFLAQGGLSAAAIATLWCLGLLELADCLDPALDELRGGGGLIGALTSLRGQARPSPVLSSVALLSTILYSVLLPALAFSLVGSIVALGGFAIASTKSASRRRFTPIPIEKRKPSRAQARNGGMRAFAACIVLVAWVLIRVFSTGQALESQGDIAYPSPVELRGSERPMPSEARGRAAAELGSQLPGIASYLEHRANQEALPFVPIGVDRPDPYSPATLPLPGEKARELRFDDSWARSVYTAVPDLSIEGMLLIQGRPTAARLGSRSARSERPLAPIDALLYIFLLIPTIGRLVAGIPRAKGDASGKLRQEA